MVIPEWLLYQSYLLHVWQGLRSSIPENEHVPWKMLVGWKNIFLLKWSLFRGHVNLRGSKALVSHSKAWWNLTELSAPAFRELCKASPNSTSLAATRRKVLGVSTKIPAVPAYLSVNLTRRVSCICCIWFLDDESWNVETKVRIMRQRSRSFQWHSASKRCKGMRCWQLITLRSYLHS